MSPERTELDALEEAVLSGVCDEDCEVWTECSDAGGIWMESRDDELGETEGGD